MAEKAAAEAPKGLDKMGIARRVAQELREGQCVNLGIGIPTLVADILPPDIEILLQSENGVLGMGPPPPSGQEDPNLTDAGKRPVTLLPGGSYFASHESFGMIRGGHVDVCVLGAMQVDAGGDLANWKLPNRKLGSVGGAMDLVSGAKRVIVAMEHLARNGAFKVVKKCTFPLTGRACVDLIITDLAVIEVTPQGLVLRETAPGVSAAQVQEASEPELIIPDDLREMAL